MNIYSRRWSVAFGDHWHLERRCAPDDDMHRWLKVFQKDEPDVLFVLAERRPLNLKQKLVERKGEAILKARKEQANDQG
jgi:hypothetical protein